MGQVQVANPRYVLIISGGCCSPKKKKFVTGGWACVCPCVTNVQKISLELMTLLPSCEDVETAFGVPLSVNATAQCKIMKDTELLKVACEQFLGYDIEEIEFALRSTLEGHLRSILGTLTVEEIYQDRDKFAALVRDVAAPDLGRMGVEIVSFTIRDITDKVGYLKALGKTQTAMVKRDASIGVAVARKDAGVREAKAEKEAMDFKYLMDAKIEKNTNTYKLSLHEFEKEIRIAEAEVALAYELQTNIISQRIKEAEIETIIAERRKLIEIGKHEVSRKELEVVGSVHLVADAEARRLETVSEGNKTEKIAMASAEAANLRLLGEAEAFGLQIIGVAEAFAMSLKAEVFKKFQAPAKVASILGYLPIIAANVSRPLSKIEEILLLGQTDDIVNSANRLLGKIPPSLRTIAGIDVTNVLKARLKAFQKHDSDDSAEETFKQSSSGA